MSIPVSVMFFFFNAKDGFRDLAVPGFKSCALPISIHLHRVAQPVLDVTLVLGGLHVDEVDDDETADITDAQLPRSEEHTSELQSRLHLVCRLLLEKKKEKSTLFTRVSGYVSGQSHE